MARKLGSWDCTFCDTKGNWGNQFECQGCGKVRARNVRFYLRDDAPIVTPEIAAQLGAGNPNWYCQHCDCGNKDTAQTCSQCGAPKGSSPIHEVKHYKAGETPRSTADAEAADLDGQSWVASQSTTPVRPVSDPVSSGSSASLSNAPVGDSSPINTFVEHPLVKQYGLLIVGAVVAIVLGIVFYNVFFNTHTETVQVSGYNWTQSVTQQEFQVVHDSSWTTHPDDAYNLTQDYLDTGRDRKVHDGWKTVQYEDTCYREESYSDTCTSSEYVSKTCSGTKDNGDGSFSDYDYECGHYESESYSCTKTHDVPYSCTKERQDELYHMEDIYDNYYTFDVNRWQTIATHVTSGTDHKPFYATDYKFVNQYDGASKPQIGQQQIFQNPGQYSVTFFCANNSKVGDNGSFTKTYDRQTWDQYVQGVDYPITVNYFNNILTYPEPK